jgi:hypothetical protein
MGGRSVGSEVGRVNGGESSVQKLAEMDGTIRQLQAAVEEIARLVRGEQLRARGEDASAAAVSPRAEPTTAELYTHTPKQTPLGTPVRPSGFFGGGRGRGAGGLEEAGLRLYTAEADVHRLSQRLETIRTSISPEAGAVDMAETEVS